MNIQALFLILTGVIVAAHAYVFLRMRRAFGHGWWQWLLLAWMLVFAVLVLLRFYSHVEISAWLSDSVVYVWLGLVVALLYVVAAFDLVSGVAWLSAALTRSAQLKRLWAWTRMAPYWRMAIVGGVLFFGYTVYEACHPRVIEVHIKTEKLPKGSAPLRVVGISDIHISTLIGPVMLDRMREAVAAQNPDILLVSGDIVDTKDVVRCMKAAAVLDQFSARLGKFAVTGNHDQMQNRQLVTGTIAKSGFTLLCGEGKDVGGIYICGVDDLTYRRRGLTQQTDVMHALRNAPQDRFVLLMNHQPEIPDDAIGLFDLQFSGHTHGGQLWPGSLLTERVYGFAQGWTDLGEKNGRRSALFISNGIGFWGMPMRCGARPDVVVFILEPQE